MLPRDYALPQNATGGHGIRPPYIISAFIPSWQNPDITRHKRYSPAPRRRFIIQVKAGGVVYENPPRQPF